MLETGPWAFAKQALVLKKWEQGMDFKTEKFPSFPVCCKLNNISRVYWSKDGLGKIASRLGTPMKSDVIMAKSIYMDYARVCV